MLKLPLPCTFASKTERGKSINIQKILHGMEGILMVTLPRMESMYIQLKRGMDMETKESPLREKLL
jgi:hypothetical protein